MDLSLGSALVFLILSFAAGLVVQACGYKRYSGSDQFDKYLSDFDVEEPVTDEEIETPNEGDRDDTNNPSSGEDLTEFDDELPGSDDNGSAMQELESIDTDFIEIIRDERDYGPEYNNWGNLYTWVLVKLDGSSRTRTIRLHGLFLATRGMFVVAIILAIFYLITIILYMSDLISIEISGVLCGSLTVVSSLLAVLFHFRAADLNQSLTDTMIKEYVAEFGS